MKSVGADGRFAVFDIDGTLVRWQLYHAVTDALAKLGHLNKKLYQQIHEARMDWKTRKNQDAFKTYEGVMVAGFEQIIKKLSTAQFNAVADSVIERYKDQVYSYTRDLIKDLKSKGYILLAISGSQLELVSRLAAYYGFDDYIGTDYLKQSGKFTGEKRFFAKDKKTALLEMIDKHDLILSGSLAIGDSASDIPMLEVVEQPIAFNPERQLFDHAQKAGWPIIVERKNVIYKLESQNGHYQLT